VQRWQALGLSEEGILAVIRRTARGRRINSPEYFSAAMQEFAGKKAVPPLVAAAPGLTRRSGTAEYRSVIPIDGILKRHGSSQRKERKDDHG
jgi:hypothetical protein